MACRGKGHFLGLYGVADVATDRNRRSPADRYDQIAVRAEITGQAVVCPYRRAAVTACAVGSNEIAYLQFSFVEPNRPVGS